MWRTRAWKLLSEHGKAIGIGGGFAGVGFAYAWNGSEQWRMARAIRNGEFRPDPPDKFREQFCIFDLAQVKLCCKDNGIVALIGLKGTGKTTTLQQLVFEADNPFYMTISNDDVLGAIYKELKDKVWRLPWLADGLRVDASKTPEKIVTEVFRLVRKQSGKQVQLGLDITCFEILPPSDGRQFLEGLTRNELPKLTSFNPRNFVKHIKYLCADARVASALFCSSEGLQIMSVNEPRLQQFMGREMGVNDAKKYLRHLDVTEESFTDKDQEEHLLGRVPRTFASLRDFARASDRKAFCDIKMGEMMNAMEELEKKGVGVRELFALALRNGRIDVRDMLKHCTTKQQFIDLYVVPNFFAPAPGGSWRLQFDCTAVAAKEVFGI